MVVWRRPWVGVFVGVLRGAEGGRLPSPPHQPRSSAAPRSLWAGGRFGWASRLTGVGSCSARERQSRRYPPFGGLKSAGRGRWTRWPPSAGSGGTKLRFSQRHGRSCSWATTISSPSTPRETDPKAAESGPRAGSESTTWTSRARWWDPRKNWRSPGMAPPWFCRPRLPGPPPLRPGPGRLASWILRAPSEPGGRPKYRFPFRNPTPRPDRR